MHEGEDETVEVCFSKTGLTVLSSSVRVATCEKDFSGIQNATVVEDYSAYSEIETFTMDDSLVCVNIAVEDDSVFEETEVFGVCLIQVEDNVVIGVNSTVQVVIVDDDG